jgi:DNA-binding MarR family transcriptional regulator
MKKEDRIVKNLLQVGAFLHRTGNRMIEDHGLNQQQFVILNEIVLRRQVSQKQLVADLLLEKSNVSKIVKKLREAKLVNVDLSTEDRRATLLSPTIKGREVCGHCMNILQNWNREWLASFSEKEKIEVLDCLQNLNALIK